LRLGEGFNMTDRGAFSSDGNVPGPFPRMFIVCTDRGELKSEGMANDG